MKVMACVAVLVVCAASPVNPVCGYMWWLNNGQKQRPGVPESAFAMLGAGSNICFVDPVNDLVVVLRWVDRRSGEILKASSRVRRRRLERGPSAVASG